MPERFVENLNNYKKALEEEFAQDHKDLEGVIEKTRSLFIEELGAYAAKMNEIALTADKENDSLNAIKYIFDFIFGKGIKDGAKTPIEKVIQELMETHTE